MKALEEKILKEGTCIGSDILKVDNFINHQLDIKFLDEMGKEIAKLFKDSGATKILTVESSGIAIAASASRAMDYIPVVFAKKTKPSTMNEDAYTSEAVSFTKGTTSLFRVIKTYINENDKVLIIDDFLARGGAALALIDICNQAGAAIVGFSAAIEKKHQGGAQIIRDKGIKVCNLAVIEKMKDGKVYFE